MPWKVSCPMEERSKFIEAWLSREHTMSELCRHFGVPRKTGYKWLGRFKKFGRDGLKDRSRAPHQMPWALSDGVVSAIVDVRKRHPTWGPKKIAAILVRQGGQKPPAVSSIGAVLSRHGLASKKRHRAHTPPYEGPFSASDAPNVTWCADFKGEWFLGDGSLFKPFTLTDAFSRFVLRCEAPARAGLVHVQPIFESAFREYGLPRAIRTDNGPPFASIGVAGISRLSVWLIKLGIAHERIEPGKPTQNGRHERMHRTLQAEVADAPEEDARTQQLALDRFRAVFNEERPHEALGQRTPSQCYARSAQTYPRPLQTPEYGDEVEVRRVRHHGDVKWKGTEIYVSEALIGEPVGISDDGEQWVMRYGPLVLGTVENGRLKRPRPGGPRQPECHP
jgi:putative transposase